MQKLLSTKGKVGRPPREGAGWIVGGCFAALLLGVWIWIQIVSDRDQRREIAASEAFIQSSTAATPDAYFKSMVERWAKLQWAMSEADPSNYGAGHLTVESLPTSKIKLSIPDGKFAQRGRDGSKDLGNVGRSYTIDLLSTLVWMSGAQIKNVGKIDVMLTAEDTNNNVASYAVELVPDESLSQAWTEWADPNLKSIVAQRMVIMNDTASGKHWVRVPKR